LLAIIERYIVTTRVHDIISPTDAVSLESLFLIHHAFHHLSYSLSFFFLFIPLMRFVPAQKLFEEEKEKKKPETHVSTDGEIYIRVWVVLGWVG